MSNRDKVYNSLILVGVVSLRGQKLVINLIIIDMPHFDLILSMDFLSKYGPKIDYRKKNIRFSLNNNEEFIFGQVQILNMMITSVKVK